MLLLPTLPPLAGESTVSWCSRLARLHADMTCADWLSAMQLTRQSVVDTSTECVERLSALTGIPACQVKACGIQSIGNRQFQYRDEAFGMYFALRKNTSYCPECLIEDTRHRSLSSGQRVGRVIWGFAPVRVCEKHKVLLHRRANLGFFEQFQDMNLVAPGDAELERLASKAQSRSVSNLQAYVGARLHGAKASGWLDCQRIHQASRACEMLGVCRVFGAHTDLNALTQAHWDEAGAAGFEAAQAGIPGIHSALAEIAEKSWKTKATGGPQAAFGRLYQWLQFGKTQKDPGPIRDVIREHILNTMAIEPGTRLFGEVVPQRRRHSVTSLASETGLHVRTLRHALVGVGLVQEGSEPNQRVSFEAERGEETARWIKNSLPVVKIPDYLICNRSQAEMLIRKGILQPLVPGNGKRGGFLSQVSIDDLDHFLRQIQSAAKKVETPDAGMVCILDAAEIARETVTDIISLVLNDSIVRVEDISQETGLRAIFVDPMYIKSIASEGKKEKGLTAQEVGERLGLVTSAVNWLRKCCDRDGKPFLPSVEVVNARGSIRHRFAENEIHCFERAHITLATLAQETGLSYKHLMQQFAEKGVEPILPRKLLNANVFRRADL